MKFSIVFSVIAAVVMSASALPVGNAMAAADIEVIKRQTPSPEAAGCGLFGCGW
ncbi:hypothetical protein DL93DRAFT_2073520 [Clavulina sp. PMI_390]|nr:hypothetical protein DL93DRAFT_2073520 [Clavulina sp. PMI_390]